MYNEPNFIKEFTDYVISIRPKKVLEVGCQSGELIKALNDEGIVSEGIDLKPSVENVVEADIRTFKTRKYYYLVFSSGLLQHYSVQDALDIVVAMGKISKDYVLNFVPNSNCVAYKNDKKRTNAEWKNELDYSVAEFAKLHQDAGLTVVDSGAMGREWAKKFDPVNTEPYLVYCLAKKE